MTDKKTPTNVSAGSAIKTFDVARSVDVSIVGNNLHQSLTAAYSVLGVAKELDNAMTLHPEMKKDFERWRDTLTDAVMTVSSSSDSTATEISSLFTPRSKK